MSDYYFRINDLESVYELPEHPIYNDGVMAVLMACADNRKVWDVTFYIGVYIIDFYGQKQIKNELERRSELYDTDQLNAYFDMSLNVEFETQ